jgi:hypothetical protein
LPGSIKDLPASPALFACSSLCGSQAPPHFPSRGRTGGQSLTDSHYTSNAAVCQGALSHH